MRTVFQPVSFDAAISIPVMESFYTLQGEGYHTGRAAYFIRLAGCDVGCTWCDVKESWTVQQEQIKSIKSLVDEIKNHPARFVVITGGEPTLYDLNPLTDALKHNGFEIAMETSGTNTISGTFDWICLSPKKFKPTLEENFKKAHELKIIVNHLSDLQWGNELAEKTSTTCRLYLQPEWDKVEKMLPPVLEFVKKNPRWRLSLQTHKYLGIP